MSDYYIKNGELYHYGVIGMKWGVRRYQNKDGTLTAAGKRKQQKLQDRYDKTKKNVAEYTNDTLTTRSKTRDMIESKMNKKISRSEKKNDKAKTRVLQAEKKNFLKDYDEGTGYIKKALKIREENYNDFGKLKIKAVSNPEIRSSPQYKRAKEFYKNQIRSDQVWGVDYTTLQEARSVAMNAGYSWTRGYLNEKKK